jgi:hypothetical protein
VVEATKISLGQLPDWRPVRCITTENAVAHTTDTPHHPAKKMTNCMDAPHVS